MFENLKLSFSGIWNSFLSYMTELSQSPFRLLTLLLDLVIVAYILYKFIVYAKKSRVWQLLKGILFILIITAISEVLQLKILNFLLNSPKNPDARQTRPGLRTRTPQTNRYKNLLQSSVFEEDK